jgi:outer membrane biosynthesis protein TonB
MKMSKTAQITNLEVAEFLHDFEENSEVFLLEEGKERNEIVEIAKAKGILLENSTDLAGFKLVYCFADKANINKARLPKDILLRALPTLIGKAIDIDHNRAYVVGHYIDYRYIQAEDKVIAYGVFFKGNFPKEWEKVVKLFQEKKLTSSYEIWCPKNKRTRLPDGTYKLTEMEIGGGCLVLTGRAAEPDAKVLELAKENFASVDESLVVATEQPSEDDLIIYKDGKVRCSKCHSCKECAMKLEKAEEIKSGTEHLFSKTELVTPSDAPKPQDAAPAPAPVPPQNPKCANCGKEFVPVAGQNETKCQNCFAIIDSTGKVIYPPQIFDFDMGCPDCRSHNWRLLEKAADGKEKIKCLSCAKEFEIEVGKDFYEGATVKLAFLVEGATSCIQCGKTIPYSVSSNTDKIKIHCAKCGLDFDYNRSASVKKSVYKITRLDNKEQLVVAMEEIKEDKIMENTEKKEEQVAPVNPEAPVAETPVEPKPVEAVPAEEPKAVEPQPIEPAPVEAPKPVEPAPAEKPVEAKAEEPTPAPEVKIEPEVTFTREQLAKELETATANLTKQLADKDLEIATIKDQSEKDKKTMEESLAAKDLELATVRTEADARVKFYTENAVKIVMRRNQLGEEFSKELSDEDILNEDKFQLAVSKKELETARVVDANKGTDAVIGDAKKDETYYRRLREEVNLHAFGHK